MTDLWITPEELGDDLAASEYALEACRSASFLLWALSGRKFSGVTTVTEVYAGVEDAFQNPQGLDLAAAYPYVVANLTSRTVNPGRSHIRLRGFPIQSVELVRVGGVDLEEGQFVIENHSTLALQSASHKPVEVTYTYGKPPPELGRMAARTLAREFALAFIGSDDCALPDRVTSISRQGISMTVLDNQDFIAELRTGVYLVDLFLKSVNPDRARARARVFSPDIPKGRRRKGYSATGGYGTGGYGQ